MPHERLEILRRHDELADLRRREEPEWRDAARILRPDEREFERGEQSARDPEVFDSSPLYALEAFAGGLFGEAVNPAERWFELASEDADLNKWGPVKRWLWDTASLLYATLSPAVAQFYPQAPAWFANIGAFGNGYLWQEERDRSIADLAMPVGEIYIDTDIDGTVNEVHRAFRRKGRQIKARWPDYPGTCADDRDYTLVHAVYPNPDFVPGRLGPRGMRFSSSYVSPDMPDFRIDKGYYELPCHHIGWNMRPGRPYASGPGHNARADMTMLNEMERSNLVATQFDAEPPILLREEGAFSAADIRPNALLEGAMSADGKPQVGYLTRNDKPGRAEQKTEQKRAAIREAFYFSIMQVVNRPQMTATEFMGWKEERFRLLGPQLVRIQQGLAPFIARRYNILARAGQAIPPPPELAGRSIGVEFVSPLAKAQKAAIGRAVLQWIGALGQIAAATQDPGIFDNAELDGTARVLHDTMVGLPDVIRDQRAVAALRQARVQTAQAAQAVERGAQLASIYADVAHASQAQTLAAGRKA